MRAPESSVEFPIYRLEWKVAQLMDGSRNLTEIARLAAREGLSVDQKLVASFVQELKGYRFLEVGREAPAPRARIEDVVAAAQRDEEKVLAQSALAMSRNGDDTMLNSYLTAILEVNPANEAARALQLELSTRLAAPAVAVSSKQPEIITAPQPAMAAPAAPAPQSRVALVTAAVAIVGVVVATAMFYQSSRDMDRVLDEVAARVAVPPRDVAPPALTRVRVELKRANVVVVTAPAAGRVTDYLVAPGDAVSAGQPIALIGDDRTYARYAAAKKELDDAERRARGVPGRKLNAARSKFRRAISRLGLTTVAAPDVGRVGMIFVARGGITVAGDKLMDIELSPALVGFIPTAAVPFTPTAAACNVESTGDACSLSESSPEGLVTVHIDNERGALKAGEMIDVMLKPAETR